MVGDITNLKMQKNTSHLLKSNWSLKKATLPACNLLTCFRILLVDISCHKTVWPWILIPTRLNPKSLIYLLSVNSGEIGLIKLMDLELFYIQKRETARIASRTECKHSTSKLPWIDFSVSHIQRKVKLIW